MGVLIVAIVLFLFMAIPVQNWSFMTFYLKFNSVKFFVNRFKNQ